MSRVNNDDFHQDPEAFFDDKDMHSVGCSEGKGERPPALLSKAIIVIIFRNVFVGYCMFALVGAPKQMGT